MNSSQSKSHPQLIVDAIHGDIHLSDLEKRVIDTASFQRLRNLKQLQMSQIVYPNATHTRFAHSIGVLGIMKRVMEAVARDKFEVEKEQAEDIQLAGLLHDVGHYPYSHLMESIDDVELSEEFVEDRRAVDVTIQKYPNHVKLGELIVTRREDLLDVLGGPERARKVADLFTRKTLGPPQLTGLINSSLDMDRFDYLLRDSHAAGVPYGNIDLNYLLNNLRVSPKGLVGLSEKALPAAEQFLLARFFMHRTVYYHKTTYGMEQVCQQLLRRARDKNLFGVPCDGNAVERIVESEDFLDFADAYVDRIVAKAAVSDVPLLRTLASSILARRPPKLLKEVCSFVRTGDRHHAGAAFRQNCRHGLQELASDFKVPLEHFLVCRIRPIKLEKRGRWLEEQEIRELQPFESEEIVRVFMGDEEEPVSLVSVDHSIISHCSNLEFNIHRLYVVRDESISDEMLGKMQQEVENWDKES